MTAPASSLSPLAIAALLASLAAHASVAMYVVNHEAGAPVASAADVGASTVDVETIAVAEPEQPEVPAHVEPPPAEAPPVANHVQSAIAQPAPASVPVTAAAPVTPAPAAAPVAAAAAAAALTAQGDDSPHFAMVLGAGAVAPGGLTRAGGGAAPGSAPAAAAASDGPFSADGVDKLAHLESGPAPAYPADARDNGVEADVPLDIVVDENGRVIDVRPTRHLGYGLDESAAAAIRGYRFAPAMRGGRPVKVRMRWTVVFRLS